MAAFFFTSVVRYGPFKIYKKDHAHGCCCNRFGRHCLLVVKCFMMCGAHGARGGYSQSGSHCGRGIILLTPLALTCFRYCTFWSVNHHHIADHHSGQWCCCYCCYPPPPLPPSSAEEAVIQMSEVIINFSPSELISLCTPPSAYITRMTPFQVLPTSTRHLT